MNRPVVQQWKSETIFSNPLPLSFIDSPINHTLISTQTRKWTVEGPDTFSLEKRHVTSGYVIVYDRLSYATVKGAGHEVPTYQPRMAYNLFQRFVIEGHSDLSS
jgi:serine carboxypeptidase-like clade II